MPKDTAKTLAKKQELDEVIFYAVDKGSPYALAMHPETNDLDKISVYKLVQLAMTPAGVANMWLWINAYARSMKKPVSPDVAAKCETVLQVRSAVYALAGFEAPK